MMKKLFMLLAVFSVPLFGQDDIADRDEYDLYDRNRDERDFNRYNYPEQVADCPYCKKKHSNQNNYYRYPTRR